LTIDCAFTGTLGRDGELKTSGKGKPYLKLNVRTGEVEDAQWVSVLSFDPDALAEAEGFKKGARVYIEGRISLNQWDDQSGAKRAGLSAMAS
jgi:single-strand DNA-binding protein